MNALARPKSSQGPATVLITNRPFPSKDLKVKQDDEVLLIFSNVALIGFHVFEQYLWQSRMWKVNKMSGGRCVMNYRKLR
jgi:hypothetical protein